MNLQVCTCVNHAVSLICMQLSYNVILRAEFLNKHLHSEIEKNSYIKKCEKNHIFYPSFVKDLYKFAHES